MSLTMVWAVLQGWRTHHPFGPVQTCLACGRDSALPEPQTRDWSLAPGQPLTCSLLPPGGRWSPCTAGPHMAKRLRPIAEMPLGSFQNPLIHRIRSPLHFSFLGIGTFFGAPKTVSSCSLTTPRQKMLEYYERHCGKWELLVLPFCRRR